MDMNLDALANTLTVNIQNEDERKNNEKLFYLYKTLPKFGPFLLEIACNINKKYQSDIQLNAAIQLKNYINANWKFTDDPKENKNLIFDEDEPIIILSKEDKEYLKANIIDAIIYMISTDQLKILKQLTQCIKKILKFEFDKIPWCNAFMDKVIEMFKSGDGKKVYSGIILFHQVSKLYEYENLERKKNYVEQFTKLNDFFLSVLNQCNNFNDNIQAFFLYKIFKIYFKNFQSSLPEVVTNEKNFDSWSNFILMVIQTPLEKPNLSPKSIFWKLKVIVYKIIENIIKKHCAIKIKKDISLFQKILYQKYILKYFETIKTIYINVNNNSLYINSECLRIIYKFFNVLINRKQYAENVISIFDAPQMKEVLIKDAMLSKEDLNQWATDPKGYISKSIQINLSFFTKRYVVYQMIHSIMQYKPKKKKEEQKDDIPPLYRSYFNFFLEVLQKNQPELQKENAELLSIKNTKQIDECLLLKENINHNLINESVLYILESINSLILKYSEDQIENIIQIFVLPAFDSVLGISRERACTFIEMFRDYKFKNENLVIELTKRICFLLQKDEKLPVKVMSAIAAPTLLKQKNVKDLFKGNIKSFLEIYLKLMEEMDQEEIVESLQIIIKSFNQEAREYIVQLADYLVKYLKKISEMENDFDNNLNSLTLSNQIISTMTEITHYFVNDTEIYPKLEVYIILVLQFCIIKDPENKLDEGIDLIIEILKNSKIPQKTIWAFFVPLIQSVTGTEEEIREFTKKYSESEFEGYGVESIGSISKIICLFISKDSETFLCGTDSAGRSYLSITLKFVEFSLKNKEALNSFNTITSMFRILIVLFQTFPGKIDNIHKQILLFIAQKQRENVNIKYKLKLIELLSECCIYNPYTTVKFYESTNEIKDIFGGWFSNIDNIESNRQLKSSVLGLCSLISINPSEQNKILLESFKEIAEKIIQLSQLIKENNEDIGTAETENFPDFNDESSDSDDEDIPKDSQIQKIVQEANKTLTGENKANNNNGNNPLDSYFDLSLDDEDDDWSSVSSLTEIDKKNEILMVKDTFNKISAQYPEYFNQIVQSLGPEKMQILQNIIQSEENRIKAKQNGNADSNKANAN